MKPIIILAIAVLLCGCEPECSLCSRSRHNVALAIKVTEDLQADVKKWRELSETWESINRFNHDSLTNCVAVLEEVERDHKAELEYHRTNNWPFTTIAYLLKRLGTNEVWMTTNDWDNITKSSFRVGLEIHWPDDGNRVVSLREWYLPTNTLTWDEFWGTNLTVTNR